MAVTVALVDAVTGAPSYTGRKIRGPLSALWFGKTAAKPLGARSGVAYGTSITTITVSGTTVTIAPHCGVLALQAALEAATYLYANDANATLTHAAAHATQARKDLIAIRLDDPAESDGSSVPAAVFTITKGAEDGSNVVPATPARSLALATVNVPASGGGASTITWTAAYAVASGGIIPVRNTTELAALWTAYPPTTDAPAITVRKDATAGQNIELSLDGTNKYVLDGRLSTAPAPGTVLAIYNYRPADAAARAALTGMRAGDIAVQVDTGVTYRYTGAAWAESLYDSGWVEPALGAGWTALAGAGNAPAYRRLNGVVYFSGAATTVATTADAFTLPAGFRPRSQIIDYLEAATVETRSTITTAGVVGQISAAAATNVRFGDFSPFPAA